MRQVIHPQMQLGEQDISAIPLDPNSCDDIPRILWGLQHIYTTPPLRERVFDILEEVLPQRPDGEVTVSADTGRPGMAHGLDVCPDQGIDGFKRYVALAVVARNLHRLGTLLQAKEAAREKRRRKRAA